MRVQYARRFTKSKIRLKASASERKYSIVFVFFFSNSNHVIRTSEWICFFLLLFSSFYRNSWFLLVGELNNSNASSFGSKSIFRTTKDGKETIKYLLFSITEFFNAISIELNLIFSPWILSSSFLSLSINLNTHKQTINVNNFTRKWIFCLCIQQLPHIGDVVKKGFFFSVCNKHKRQKATSNEREAEKHPKIDFVHFSTEFAAA